MAFQVFCIPTNDADLDTENDSPELAPAAADQVLGDQDADTSTRFEERMTEPAPKPKPKPKPKAKLQAAPDPAPTKAAEPGGPTISIPQAGRMLGKARAAGEQQPEPMHGFRVIDYVLREQGLEGLPRGCKMNDAKEFLAATVTRDLYEPLCDAIDALGAPQTDDFPQADDEVPF